MRAKASTGSIERVLSRPSLVHLPRVVLHADIILIRMQVLGPLYCDQAQHSRQLAHPLRPGLWLAGLLSPSDCAYHM